MNVLAFKISGKFAHFRRFYTTTSPLTFQIPPFTAVKGILGAILGLEKDSNNESMNTAKIGVKLNNSVSNKKMFGMNFLDTKRGSGHIQVRLETIINPSYTIYIADEGFEYYQKLKNNLEQNYRYYTTYLGISEFIANIQYMGEQNTVSFENKENVYINSLVPEEYFEEGKNISLEEGVPFEFEKVPFQMDNQRNVLSLKEFLFVPDGTAIKLKKASCIDFNGENIILC
ncbi:type I-B CRISPR-associated protein Cas5b [Candidatus Absconditicoccus praedator]|uniref:type I-B CRISPR-associated protein Cas5b n=1 Tax=Candidatus Absconditicoccus praedator TaxID=2735562 RepID=UPI001E6496AC|nr:type I-B CRISPR-associated protein Cas5b [Candidatus Absconditicoccus praedator]UFX82688.1 type I-B CRISPR-associated protein Cas5 [Candidatus Absconditicoccus praedator]